MIDSASESHSVLKLEGITKRFGATHALNGIDLDFQLGEFVAVLGPNGAGKSTLIKVLDRVYQPDSGAIHTAAGRNAMGVVHQDLGLVPNMSIAENIALGRGRHGLLNLKEETREARESLDLVGLAGTDPHALIESLSLGQQALVAVAKVLSRGAQIVIVDEVTAGLHPDEARWTVDKLGNVARSGTLVLMVTHKLHEVISIASRFVMLVDGRVKLDSPADEVTLEILIDYMSSGRSVSSTDEVADATTTVRSGTICSLSSVYVSAAGPIDLDIEAGEVVGLTGIVGSGLHEVAYVAAGRIKPRAGTVTTAPNIHRACVPAHRETEGVFPDGTQEFNLSAGAWRKWRRKIGLLDVLALRSDCEDLSRLLQVVPSDLEAPIGSLSGGNQQKTILGRALIESPDLLVLCEPTRGVDVPTRREIYSQIRRVAGRGVGVLLASTDFEDLTMTANRIGVIGSDGRIGRWVGAADVDDFAAELI